MHMYTSGNKGQRIINLAGKMLATKVCYSSLHFVQEAILVPGGREERATGTGGVPHGALTCSSGGK